MPPTPDNNPLNSYDTKAKLKQIRADYTRARNIIDKLEAYFATFAELRKKLDDDKDGLETNLVWSQTKKSEMDALVAQATTSVEELTTIVGSAQNLATQVQEQYDSFSVLAAKIADPNSGIQAMLNLAVTMRDDIQHLLTATQSDAATAATALSEIQAQSDEVTTAYDAFMDLKKKIDDPDDGVAAILAEVKQYSVDTLAAKKSAESDSLSIASLKESADEQVAAATVSKEEIDKLQAESQNLTETIRNSLDLTAAYSLSHEIQTQRKKLDKTLKWWGLAVAVTILLLAATLGLIFYTLFIDGDSKSFITSVNDSNVLLTVLSKALFTSPFVFALYFTTTNFSRTREMRDKYVAKEISAKNLQAYVQLLRDEFPNNSDERIDFALHNMQAIYNDPSPSKKRSYNIGINKIFQLGVEEEDTEQLKDSLLGSAEQIVRNRTKKTDDQ